MAKGTREEVSTDRKAQQRGYDNKRPGIPYSLHFDDEVYDLLEDLRYTLDMDKKECIQYAIRFTAKHTSNFRPSPRRLREEKK